MEKGFSNPEALIRMNFLYQAASLLLTSEPAKDNRETKEAVQRKELSRYYVKTLKDITKKLVIRIDKDTKQTICKVCHGLLILNATATTFKSKKKGRQNRERHIVECTYCHTRKEKILLPRSLPKGKPDQQEL